MRWLCLCAVVGMTLSATGGAAQDAPLAFEVATIRPNTSADRSTSFMPRPGAFSVVNATVMQLVRFAFQIQDFQVSGQPSWFNSERYDIQAKAPAGVAAENADVWQAMLRTLLADRFKLGFHIEQREQSVYELTVSKSGHTLSPVEPTDCGPGECGFRASSREIVGNQVTMDALAARLSRSIGRPVVNKTNLSGAFNLLLRWTPDPQLGLRPDQAPQDGGPSMFTAIQEQLGLRLEGARGPVAVHVIDRIERPSDN